MNLNNSKSEISKISGCPPENENKHNDQITYQVDDLRTRVMDILGDSGNTESFVSFLTQVYLPLHDMPSQNSPAYSEYLKKAELSYQEFNNFVQTKVVINSNPLELQEGKELTCEANMGGLIPEAYIREWGVTKPSVQEEVREKYYHPVEVFRGGRVPVSTDPHDLLNAFRGPVAINAPYRTLAPKSLRPESFLPIQAEEIRNVLELYNKVLSSDFTKRNKMGDLSLHADVAESERQMWKKVGMDVDETAEQALQEGKYLPYMLFRHQEGGSPTHDGGSSNPARLFSPCVSTSEDESISFGCAIPREGENYGVMVNSLLPKHGMIYSPDAYKMPLMNDTAWQTDYQDPEHGCAEDEVLVMGAIDPNATMSVNMYGDLADPPIAEAFRDGKNRVILRDHRNNTEECWGFNDNGELKIESTRAIGDGDSQSDTRLPEQAGLKLEFNTGDLQEIFSDQNFSPEKLLSLLDKQYPGIYEQDAGVSEGYTLGEHTLMVMRQFEKYFGEKDLPSDINKNMFRLILALHDIGKPEAISMGDKELQHEFTQKHIKSLFGSLGIDAKHTALALVLASGDPIGKYLTSRMNTEDTRMAIEEMASRAQIPTDQFFELLCIYFKVDAGSYTENAGGLASLDEHFDFDEEAHLLNFAPHVQERIDQLK